MYSVYSRVDTSSGHYPRSPWMGGWVPNPVLWHAAQRRGLGPCKVHLVRRACSKTTISSTACVASESRPFSTSWLRPDFPAVLPCFASKHFRLMRGFFSGNFPENYRNVYTCYGSEPTRTQRTLTRDCRSAAHDTDSTHCDTVWLPHRSL